MWNKFLADTGITDVDDGSLITQHVHLKIFEGMLKMYTRIEQVESEILLITQDEANALRYSAKYVPFALKMRFSKRLEIVAFLPSLGKEGVESSFLEYTREWVKHVNWGGLFQVNDEVFCLFVGIEMKLRRHLLCLFKTNAIKKEDVIEDIIHNDDVLFRWTAVTSDLDDEDLAKELLQHIVELWVTISGFSAAGAWMEYYKQHIENTTKGACG